MGIAEKRFSVLFSIIMYYDSSDTIADAAQALYVVGETNVLRDVNVKLAIERAELIEAHSVRECLQLSSEGGQ